MQWLNIFGYNIYYLHDGQLAIMGMGTCMDLYNNCKNREVYDSAVQSKKALLLKD